MSEQKGYDAFGDQWFKEMMKWSKIDLINALREAWKEKNNLEARLNLISENVGAVSFQLMKDANPDGLQEYMSKFVLWFIDNLDNYGSGIAMGEITRYKAGMMNNMVQEMSIMFQNFDLFLQGKTYAEVMQPKSEQYIAGYDAGMVGSNESNTHFSNFSTPEKTKEWERGKRDAEAHKKEHGVVTGYIYGQPYQMSKAGHDQLQRKTNDEV